MCGASRGTLQRRLERREHVRWSGFTALWPLREKPGGRGHSRLPRSGLHRAPPPAAPGAEAPPLQGPTATSQHRIRALARLLSAHCPPASRRVPSPPSGLRGIPEASRNPDLWAADRTKPTAHTALWRDLRESPAIPQAGAPSPGMDLSGEWAGSTPANQSKGCMEPRRSADPERISHR